MADEEKKKSAELLAAIGDPWGKNVPPPPPPDAVEPGTYNQTPLVSDLTEYETERAKDLLGPDIEGIDPDVIRAQMNNEPPAAQQQRPRMSLQAYHELMSTVGPVTGTPVGIETQADADARAERQRRLSLGVRPDDSAASQAADDAEFGTGGAGSAPIAGAAGQDAGPSDAARPSSTTKSAAATGAGVAPGAAGSSVGGYGLPPPQDPIEIRAGLEMGNIKTPGEYAMELRSDIASGKVSPEEGKRRSQEYRKWYDSAAGGALRLESSQVAQQRQVADAQIEQQRADIETAQQLADIKAQAAQNAADMEEQRQAATEAYNKSVADSQKNLQEAMARSEAFKIDPSRTFSHGGAGVVSGIFAAIGLAFGGAGQALSRGQQPNPLPPMIEKMVDREVDSQKHEAATLAKGVADRQNLMSLARVHFADEEQQRAVAKATMWESLALEAQKKSDEATTDRNKRAIALVADQLRQKAADQQLAFETRSKALAEQARIQAANAMAGAQAAKAQSASTDALLRFQKGGATVAIDVAGDPLWSKLAMNYSQPLGKYLLNEHDLKTAQGVNELKSIAASIDEMKAIVARNGSSWDKTDKARLEALASQIKPRMAVAAGQGAMSEGDQANIEKGLPEGGIDVWGTQLDRLEVTARAIRQKAADTARAIPGIPGAAPQMLPDEHGVPRLYAQPMAQGLDDDRGFVEVGEGKGKKKVRIGAPVGPTAPPADVTITPGASKEPAKKSSPRDWWRTANG